MKATSVERGALTRRLRQSGLAGLIGLLALGACGNDGPKYGEIPRDAGRSGSGGKGSAGGTVQVMGGDDAGGDDAGGAGGDDSGNPRAGNASHGGSGGKGGMGGSGGSTTTGGSGGSGGGTVTDLCGNSVVDPGETCDDGNKVSGDGCSSACQCACEACEASEACYWRENHLAQVPPFLDFYEQGYQMEGLSTEGPAPNVPKNELFRVAVDCVRKTQCLTVLPAMGVTLVKCACLNPSAVGADPAAWPADCFTDALMPGPCLDQFLEAAEAGSLVLLKNRMGTQEYAVGLVQGLFNNCDVAECRTECFTPAQVAAMPTNQYADDLYDCGDCEAENACTVAP